MPASHKENDMLASTVLLQTESGSFNAYLARSDRPNGAGIVVLQEIFGVNANMRAVSDAFSAAGFNAIVPDLFWRQQPDVDLDPATDRERATELMKGLNTELAVADALVAADYLRTLDGANGKVGAVGYCLGGKLAFRSEEHTSELQSLMRISYAVFCLKKKNNHIIHTQSTGLHDK